MNERLYMCRHGIVVCDRCGAESAGDPEPARLLRALGGRDRARARRVPAVRLQAPAGPARGGIRGIPNRGAAPPLSTAPGAVQGARRVAHHVPAVLGKARRCPGTTPGKDEQDGEGSLCERKEDMSSRKPYMPGPASGADVEKEGDKWTLVLVRDLRHEPEKVWEA